VDYANIAELAHGVSLILDGTDNFEVRYLINDVSLEKNIPWIFTGCTGAVGQVMPVFPHESACLRCLMPLPPPPGATETCDTAGVLGPAVNVVASLQAAIALRILVGQSQQIDRKLHIVDVWNGSFRAVDVSKLRESQQCPACQNGERLWLTGSQRSASTVLCGRNAVQITPPEKLALFLRECNVQSVPCSCYNCPLSRAASGRIFRR
jgi:adenylyltransferase/sulfurtransferase